MVGLLVVSRRLAELLGEVFVESAAVEVDDGVFRYSTVWECRRIMITLDLGIPCRNKYRERVMGCIRSKREGSGFHGGW
jgi:hypothetical protein